ncbi:MAG: toxic anion resistance protein [Fibrobacteria bacterium]|nr:toxic anion resistance protein [Fibrobacteria bacterium]
MELQAPAPVDTALSEVATLSESDRAKVESIGKSIQVGDTQSLLQFGVATQGKIAGFADTILGEIRNKDAGYVGDTLSGLLGTVREIDVGSLSNESILARVPILGKFFSALHRFIERYETLSVQVERIVSELEKARMQLLRDVALLDGLFEKNGEYIKELDLHILAGQQIMQTLRTELLPALQAQAQASGDPVDAQKAQDGKQFLERFEKKLHDLKLSRMVAVQSSPQIRLIQNNNQLLVEKIQTSILSTIPLWKSQIVIAITLFRQKKAVQLQKQVSDTTNDLLRKNSEMLKETTVDVARESERGIVDIETLKKVNEDLLSTIEETMRIQQDGREKRRQAETELVRMESDLKKKLLEVATDGGTARLVANP